MRELALAAVVAGQLKIAAPAHVADVGRFELQSVRIGTQGGKSERSAGNDDAGGGEGGE